MERPTLLKTSARLGLAMALLTSAATGTGCRSTRSEVPPHRSHSGDGKHAPIVGFSSEPDSINPNGFAAMPGSSAGNGGGPSGKLGMPGSGSGVMGAPTGNAFGPMGATPSPSDGSPAPTPTPTPTQGQSSAKVPTQNPFD